MPLRGDDGHSRPAAVDVHHVPCTKALLAGIQGGVAIMMSTGDSTHLRAALDTGIEHLGATTAAAGTAATAGEPART